MTANPLKAPRHRPGKAIADSDSSSEPETSEDETPPETQKPIPPSKFISAAGIASSLKKFDLDERQRIASSKSVTGREEEKPVYTHEEKEFVTESNSESEESSEEEKSSEEESSEEEVPRQVLLRPTFIKKENRKKFAKNTIQHGSQNDQHSAEKERKKIEVDEIVEEQIKKDLAARAAGKKHWDDDEEEDDIDDTDDIDPEAEYAAWKLRELKRIKREREEIEKKEKEMEEIERRKNLSAEERMREDDEYIARQKEEKEGKSKMLYMQKYFHKGAFYQEEAKSAGLHQRNIMGAKIQDEFDRELLPKYLQQRDMAKIGKKGATKYRDLKTEDTGQWGQFNTKTREAYPGISTNDERFKPDKNKSALGPTGANSISVDSRKRVLSFPNKADNMKKEGFRDSGENEQPYRRSQSRSPLRDRIFESHRHKRSVSRDVTTYESEKRRRKDLD